MALKVCESSVDALVGRLAAATVTVEVVDGALLPPPPGGVRVVAVAEVSKDESEAV